MVGTLTGPTAVVHGSTSLWRQTALHTVGLLLGAVPVGLVLGVVGRAAGARTTSVGLAAAWALFTLAYALHEVGLVRLPHPQRAWQVPTGWRRRYPPRRVAFAYGLLLGPGFLVFVRTSAYYVLVAGVVLAGSPALGAAAFGLLALGRALPLVVSSLHQWRGGTLPGLLARTVAADNTARLSAGVALAAMGGTVLGLVL